MWSVTFQLYLLGCPGLSLSFSIPLVSKSVLIFSRSASQVRKYDLSKSAKNTLKVLKAMPLNSQTEEVDTKKEGEMGVRSTYSGSTIQIKY